MNVPTNNSSDNSNMVCTIASTFATASDTVVAANARATSLYSESMMKSDSDVQHVSVNGEIQPAKRNGQISGDSTCDIRMVGYLPQQWKHEGTRYTTRIASSSISSPERNHL